jgi:predicted dehydrogenase
VSQPADAAAQLRMVSEPVDVAVVGVGYLGALHAEKYAAHPGARLRALVDPDPRAGAVAERLGVLLYPDLDRLPHEVRAASVAVPTPLHHAVGCRLMRSGRDVLIEKPIAASRAEADELVGVAEATGRILQVGHLERFNPAIRKLGGLLREPRFIESHRLAPFNVRGTDVDVVLDLMIHDIDIILSIVRSRPASIHAAGVPVISGSVDIANARIEFEDGCVANITASRVSAERMRKIRVFQRDAYVSIDFLRRSATIVRREPRAGGAPSTTIPATEAGASVPARAAGASGPTSAAETAPVPAFGGSPGQDPAGRDVAGGSSPQALARGAGGAIVREEVTFEDEAEDPLALEIDAFLRAVVERSEPLVSGRDGCRALAVAEQIMELMGGHGA